MAMLAPVHVENVGRLFGSNQPIYAHFTAFNSSDQLQRKRSSIIQEALHRQTHAHEPHLPTPDAHGAPGPRICQATASPAPAQDVARRILGEDVTQIDDYTERVKRMVGKVPLQRHHPLRPGRLRPCGRRSRRLLRSSRAERRRYLAEGQRGGATT